MLKICQEIFIETQKGFHIKMYIIEEATGVFSGMMSIAKQGINTSTYQSPTTLQTALDIFQDMLTVIINRVNEWGDINKVTNPCNDYFLSKNEQTNELRNNHISVIAL